MKRKYQKPAIEILALDTEENMLDSTSRIELVREEASQDLPALSKDQDESHLWDLDDDD